MLGVFYSYFDNEQPIASIAFQIMSLREVQQDDDAISFRDLAPL
jgi:hypothetical protein